MTDQTRDIVELELCPFCGSAPKFNTHYAWCSARHMMVQLPLDQWNMRAIEAAGVEALTKRVAELEEALRRIAEGNLGSMPWQADYAKIREVASAALSNAASGEEG
jgi:hypothetical protein